MNANKFLKSPHAGRHSELLNRGWISEVRSIRDLAAAQIIINQQHREPREEGYAMKRTIVGLIPGSKLRFMVAIALACFLGGQVATEAKSTPFSRIVVF